MVADLLCGDTCRIYSVSGDGCIRLLRGRNCEVAIRCEGRAQIFPLVAEHVPYVSEHATRPIPRIVLFERADGM